ncbi:helicase [Rhodobacter phage RcMotherGoose]|nr:helicase [Rhodobacter phage RcMotherGoose]
MFESRWYQDEAEYAIFDYFAKGNRGNPVVAMPTGTGKSVVISRFVKRAFELFPGQRMMMLTHVKELIEQNADKMRAIAPNIPVGIYSAGLHSKCDFGSPLIFGGVQSVAPAIKKAIEGSTALAGFPHFGKRDLLLIDECHLLSPNDDTTYQFVYNELLKVNPFLKVVGFTATPYRLKQGMITDGGVFTDICYDLTTIDSFNRLIAEGYLAPLIPRPTNTVIDISNVGIIAGEYNKKQLEEALDDDNVTFDGVKEMVELGADRACWLVFAAGVKNAEKIAAMLNYLGIPAAAVHSDNKPTENDRRIEAFKSGELRALVNANKLTTGFDHPPIDLIGMFRPTLSPGLWVQMLGRGTRPSPKTGKTNCLVLDFARNTPRLGPINDPRIPGRPKPGEAGDMPVRICDCCGVYNHAGARFCINCGTEFTFENKLFKTAGTQDLIRGDAPVIETFPVRKVIYNLHEKRDANGSLTSPPMIKVSYFAGLQTFNEYVMLEHGGFVGKKARQWWQQRHAEEPPATTYQALQRVSELRQPRSIRVWLNKKYPEILSCEW